MRGESNVLGNVCVEAMDRVVKGGRTLKNEDGQMVGRRVPLMWVEEVE